MHYEKKERRYDRPEGGGCKRWTTFFQRCSFQANRNRTNDYLAFRFLIDIGENFPRKPITYFSLPFHLRSMGNFSPTAFSTATRIAIIYEISLLFPTFYSSNGRNRSQTPARDDVFSPLFPAYYQGNNVGHRGN